MRPDPDCLDSESTMTEHKPTRSELKRQAILQAARDAFQERGVHSTSMDELAALASVSSAGAVVAPATKQHSSAEAGRASAHV